MSKFSDDRINNIKIIKSNINKIESKDQDKIYDIITSCIKKNDAEKILYIKKYIQLVNDVNLSYIGKIMQSDLNKTEPKTIKTTSTSIKDLQSNKKLIVNKKIFAEPKNLFAEPKNLIENNDESNDDNNDNDNDNENIEDDQ